MHNHPADDANFGKPVICTKQGGALVDDIIKATPDYLFGQLHKDFERQYRMPLTHKQAWSMKQKV